MKFHTPPLPLTRFVDAETEMTPQDVAARAASAVAGSAGAIALARGSISTSLRVVGVLAFCQSLLFVVLWLLICAWAGAATVPPKEFAPDLQLSTFSPNQARDPFLTGPVAGPVSAAASVPATAFVLQGILYDPTKPAAMINNELVVLGRPTAINVPGGVAQVKAVQITRQTVVLEVAGQRIALHLGATEPGNEAKP